MERKGLFKLPFQILLYEIPKYLELTDYLNYTLTCKFLYNNMEKSDIWKSELKEKYTEEEIDFAQDKDTAFDKFKKLKTLTQNYHQCDIAHIETCWTDKENGLHLKNVCWLHIIGKFNNVPDGRYIPEFKVKISRRPLGLSRLAFNATVMEVPINIHEKEDDDDDIQQDQPTQERDGEEPTESADDTVAEINNNNYNNNNNNNTTSLFSMALSVLSLGIIRLNDTQNREDNANNNDNNDNDDNEIPSRELMTTQNKFTNDTLNIYRNNEWRIIECPEIIIDHSLINTKESKIVVELEIKDINGYWKNGLSFKGMRLRKVESE